MAKRQPKYKKFIGFIYVGISAVFIYLVIMAGYRVVNKTIEYDVLVEQRDALMKEKKELSKEVELLADDDYVTRYARENYIFSKEGEEVVKLPEK